MTYLPHLASDGVPVEVEVGVERAFMGGGGEVGVELGPLDGCGWGCRRAGVGGEV